jgi:hypothetical protein
MVQLVLAVFAASAHASGPSPEKVRFNSSAYFTHEISHIAFGKFASAGEAAPIKGGPLMLTAAKGAALAATAKAPVKQLSLAKLLNKHLTTDLAFTMGGKQTWMSGAFDKTGENAYVSVLEDGKAAKFFNVKGILDEAKFVTVGSAKYKISIKADVFNQMESLILFENDANRRDKPNFSLKDMIDSVGKAGEQVAAGGATYSLFYYHEVSGAGEGVVDSKSQLLTFLHTSDKGEFAVWVIPASELADGKLRAYTMQDNKTVGLQIAGDTLKVYDQP